MFKNDIEMLVLHISASWAKIAEAIDFAKAVGSKKCFPIHDGILYDNERKAYVWLVLI